MWPSYFWLLIFGLLASVSPVLSLAFPYSDGSPTLQHRTTPYFPADPPSCPICESDYANINSCAQACPVLANLTTVCEYPRERWNLRARRVLTARAKLGFLLGDLQSRCFYRCPPMLLHRHIPFCFSSVCRLVSVYNPSPRRPVTDSDQSFGQTNQTWVLGEDSSLPSVVNNLRDACAFASTILGHAASADSELPSSTSTPLPTSTSSGGSHPEYSVQVTSVAITILVSVLCL